MFDPVTYNVTEGNSLRISFVTSQPLLGNSIVRLYDIPTAGVTNHATGEYLNVIYNVIHVSIIIAGVDYGSFNTIFTLYASATRYNYSRYIYRDNRAEFPEQFSATLEFVSGWPLIVTGPNATININNIDGNFPFLHIIKNNLYSLVPTIWFSHSYNWIYSQETTNINLTLSGVTSQPLLGDTIIKLIDVPTPGASNPATSVSIILI